MTFVVVWTQRSTVHTRPTSEDGIQLPKWQGNWKRSHMRFIPRKMGVLPPKKGNIEGCLAVEEALLSSPSFVVWSTKATFVLNRVELGGNKPDKQLHVLCFYLAEVESAWYMRKSIKKVQLCSSLLSVLFSSSPPLYEALCADMNSVSPVRLLFRQSLIIIIYPLTARVIGAPQMISQLVSSLFPCSPLPSGTWQIPGLSIP